MNTKKILSKIEVDAQIEGAENAFNQYKRMAQILARRSVLLSSKKGVRLIDDC